MTSYTRIIASASKLRTQIADKVAAASKLSGDLEDANADIEALKGKLAELESRAADKGLSVADLHAAVDELKEEK